MKKIYVLLWIAALLSASAQSQDHTHWRTLIDEATYQCDTAPTVMLKNNRESFSEASLETLSQKLTPLLKIYGTELTEANLAAGRTLAAYRAQYAADRNMGLPKWEEPEVRFLISGTDVSGTEIAFLGAPFTMYAPGKPFRNGRLIDFNAQRLWFEFDDGILQEYAIGLAPVGDDPAAPGLTLFTDQANDQDVIGALIGEMGYTCSILGKPRTIDGQFRAPTLKMLFFELLEQEGYQVFQKAQSFTIVRPNSSGMVDLEAALRNVSISEKGGVVRFGNTPPEEMGFFGPDDAGNNPKNYAIPAEDGSGKSISLMDSEGIARYLLNDSIKRLGSIPADEATVSAHMMKKLEEISFGKPALKKYMMTTLPRGFKLALSSESDHHRLQRAKMMIHCLLNEMK